MRLQLHALAYNLANFMRTLALPEAIKQWSLTSLKEKLIKIGVKVGSDVGTTWRTNRRDHNGSATGRDRAQCSLRAGLEHRWRDCRFRNRLFTVFPVTRHSPQTKCIGSLSKRCSQCCVYRKPHPH
jgi:hypothetical protein